MGNWQRWVYGGQRPAERDTGTDAYAWHPPADEAEFERWLAAPPRQVSTLPYRPLPGEGIFSDEDVRRIIANTPYLPDPGDPMLPRGSDHCRCLGCGEYFNSTYAFSEHRVGRVGTPERRCLTAVERRSAGWKQGPLGHWLTPRMGAGRAVRRREVTP
jgi:hypothetical protein